MDTYKYCYQGVPGCYSQQACEGIHFKNKSKDNLYFEACEQFTDVFDAVLKGDCFGVIPVENSLGGSIHENFDLIQKYAQYIEVTQEYNLRIEHCLIGIPGTKISNIQYVKSHPQALAQCSNNIEVLFQNKIVKTPISDTAIGAKLLRNSLDNKESDMLHTAIIASRNAAKIYNLEILKDEFEDQPENYTRFWVIQKRKDSDKTPQVNESKSNLYKNSLLFTLDHTAGSLSKILSIFSICNANLTKIESRPLKTRNNDRNPFQYWFFVDFVESFGLTEKSRVIPMLLELQGTIIHSVISLGIYPQDDRVYVPQHSLNIGIVGGGVFGQCIASLLDSTHNIIMTSRSDYSEVCQKNGWTFCDQTTWNQERKDIILIAVSIDSFQETLDKIDFKDELVVDVLSVKSFPKRCLLDKIPETCDILCSHPMFGPNSISNYVYEKPSFIYDSVRIRDQKRLSYFIESISNYCKLHEMDCDQHDQEIGIYQALTHFTNRMLTKTGFQNGDTRYVAKSTKLIRESINKTSGDSDSLYKNLFEYNLYSKNVLKILYSNIDKETNNIINKVNLTAQNVEDLICEQPIGTNEFDAYIKKFQHDHPNEELIQMHIGEPQYRPPHSVYNLLKSIGNDKPRITYTSIKGTEDFKQGVVDHYQLKGIKYTKNNVICCNGGKQAIYQAIRALTDEKPDHIPNWEIILPVPYWCPYKNMINSSRAELVLLYTCAQENYKLTYHNLSQHVSSKSRILILCSPHNPTGIVYSREELVMISKICDTHPNLYIIWDEIYSDIILEPGYTYQRLLEVSPSLRDRIITINGFSKTYAMTGFRIGYALAHEDIVSKMAFYQGQITSSAGYISQQAGILSLQEYQRGEYIPQICETLREYVASFISCFERIQGLQFTVPLGGMYIYVNLKNVDISDSYTWCCNILNKYRVSFMPGIVFGDPTSIRICFAMDKTWIEKAISIFYKEFSDKLTSLLE